jgi:hypothetical protein
MLTLSTQATIKLRQYNMQSSKKDVVLYGLLMTLVLGVCTAAVHARIQPPVASQLALSNARLSSDPLAQTQQLKEEIVKVFSPLESAIPGVAEAMIRIADCESYGGQDGMLMHIGPDGELVENSRSSATGVFQVLLYTHRSDYEALELDPRSVIDNIKFARKLVERRQARGLNPYGDWECSPD